MAPVLVAEEQFNKVLADVEILIEDVASLFDQTEVAKRRMVELRLDPALGKSEQELDEYLKKRGVNVDGMGNKRASRFF